MIYVFQTWLSCETIPSYPFPIPCIALPFLHYFHSHYSSQRFISALHLTCRIPTRTPRPIPRFLSQRLTSKASKHPFPVLVPTIRKTNSQTLPTLSRLWALLYEPPSSTHHYLPHRTHPTSSFHYPKNHPPSPPPTQPATFNPTSPFPSPLFTLPRIQSLPPSFISFPPRATNRSSILPPSLPPYHKLIVCNPP